MIGYKLKPILELVPEAMPMVKQANLEREYPVDSKDNCMASALAIQYDKHIVKKATDYDILTKVAEAVQVFGIENEVSTLTEKMINRSTAALFKAASQDSEETFIEKQAAWLGERSGFKDVEQLVKSAEELKVIADKLGLDVANEVKPYICDGYMSKQAAIDALSTRYHLTKKDVFVKLAAAIGKQAEFISGDRVVKSLCQTVSKFDKQAGLAAKGFDFYREVMITKSAAVDSSMVNLCGNLVSIQKIMSIPDSYLDSYIGKNFAKELNSDPVAAKSVVESLPVDVQKVLLELVKNV